MDKIQKFLALLSKKERSVLVKVLVDIRTLKLGAYDIKPLKGYKDFFRLRKGKIRVVFTKNENKIGIIVDISYRKDAYKGL